MKNQIYKYIQMDVHKCKYIYFSNDFFQCSREDRESYPVGLEQSLIHSLHLSRSWVFLFRHEFNFPAAHRWGHRALQLPPSEKKKSAIIISSSFRASLTYVLSSVLFLFLNMICEGFFKNNVHWNIRFYVRSALNLGRSLHASLLWVWKKGDGRCACVFVAWGGGDFRNKDNWCVRSFPCQTQRRAKEEKFKSESTSEEKKKKGIACFAEIASATATRCLKEFSSRSQENEEDIRMWWINDHHHSNWKSQGSPRWSADAREIPLCLQRLLQALCY